MQWPAVSKGRCQLRRDMLMDALRSTAPQRCAQTHPIRFRHHSTRSPPERDRRAGRSRSLLNQRARSRRDRASRHQHQHAQSPQPPDAGMAAVPLSIAPGRRPLGGVVRSVPSDLPQTRPSAVPVLRRISNHLLTVRGKTNLPSEPLSVHKVRLHAAPARHARRHHPGRDGSDGRQRRRKRSVLRARPRAHQPPRALLAPRTQTSFATTRPQAPDHSRMKESQLVL